MVPLLRLDSGKLISVRPSTVTLRKGRLGLYQVMRSNFYGLVNKRVIGGPPNPRHPLVRHCFVLSICAFALICVLLHGAQLG